MGGSVHYQYLSSEEQDILYKAYYGNVYNTVYRFTKDRELAEEVTHEAYLVAFQKIHTVKDMEKFKGWICTIALNLARDYMRKHKRVSAMDAIEQLGQNAYTVEEEVIARMERDVVKEAIGELDAHYKHVIILRYYYDLSYKDIAEKLNISSGTVKTRINRAKGKLYHLLCPSFFSAMQREKFFCDPSQPSAFQGMMF